MGWLLGSRFDFKGIIASCVCVRPFFFTALFLNS